VVDGPRVSRTAWCGAISWVDYRDPVLPRLVVLEVHLAGDQGVGGAWEDGEGLGVQLRFALLAQVERRGRYLRKVPTFPAPIFARPSLWVGEQPPFDNVCPSVVPSLAFSPELELKEEASTLRCRRYRSELIPHFQSSAGPFGLS
jgi:hypothetical protein